MSILGVLSLSGEYTYIAIGNICIFTRGKGLGMRVVAFRKIYSGEYTKEHILLKYSVILKDIFC